MGRTASLAAKQALLGKEIIVVNCEKAIITGRRGNIIENYLRRKALGGHSQKGPYIKSAPERIMKRTIRGMLPYKKGRGAEAFKRIKCYNLVPKGIEAGKGKNKVGMELNELSARIKS